MFVVCSTWAFACDSIQIQFCIRKVLFRCAYVKSIHFFLFRNQSRFSADWQQPYTEIGGKFCCSVTNSFVH